MCNNLQQQFAIVVFALSLYILIRMSLFGNRFAPTDSLSLYQKGNNLKQLLLLSKIVHNSIIQIQMVKNIFLLQFVCLLSCFSVCLSVFLSLSLSAFRCFMDSLSLFFFTTNASFWNRLCTTDPAPDPLRGILGLLESRDQTPDPPQKPHYQVLTSWCLYQMVTQKLVRASK